MITYFSNYSVCVNDVYAKIKQFAYSLYSYICVYILIIHETPIVQYPIQTTRVGLTYLSSHVCKSMPGLE